MKRRKASGWPWLELGLQSARLAIEAQQVVALRLARLAAGGPRAGREAARMVTEKVGAFATAQRMMLGATSRAESAKASKQVLALYRRRVAANKRRLSKKARRGAS
jgi:hypothetical protein